MKFQFTVKYTRCLRLHTGQDTGPIASDLKTTVNDELKGKLSGLNYFTDLQNRKHPRSLNSVFLNLKVKTLNAELNPICYFLALLAHHFLHVSRISVNQLLYCVSLKIYNKFANYFCELKFSGNTHQRP